MTAKTSKTESGTSSRDTKSGTRSEIESEMGTGAEREALSRRVTGVESQYRPREVLKRVQKDGTSSGTPPKLLHPEPIRPHTNTTVGARPKRTCGPIP